MNSNRDIDLSQDDYVLSHTDLTLDHKPELPVFYLLIEGTVNLECKLLETSSHCIVMVAYIEYDSVLNIDKDGQIFFNEKLIAR